jgi:CRISPR-associated protein Cmr1
MSKVHVRLRVVTPLFMAGAEPRGNVAELRAASVRGVMRWWLRALLGGTGWAGRDFADVAALWQQESVVFGSVEPAPNEQEIRRQREARHAEPGGSSASAVTLYISDVQGRALPLEPTPGRQPKRDYLLYGLHAQPRQNQPTRYYYPPGTQFTLHLQTRLGARQAQRAFTRACAALWLLIALGGLGARTRRGTGCLAVESVEGDWPEGVPPLLQSATMQTPAELRT